jgi:hypothetical protein
MKNDEITRLSNKSKLFLSDLESSELCHIFVDIKNSLLLSKPRQILFHVANDVLEIPKCLCGKELLWHDDERRYRKYCSKSCTAKFTVQEKKVNNMKELGVEWHSQLDSWRKKVKKTSNRKYGVDHYSQTKEFISRTKKSNVKKFGVEYPSQSPKIQQYIKDQCMKKYGVDNPSKAESCKNKLKTTCKEKYGVENCAMQEYSLAAIEFLTNTELFISECMTTPVLILSKKYGISTNPIYTRIHKLNLSLPKFDSSGFEQDVFDFISKVCPNLTITRSKRDIVKNKEIDIFIPEKKLGIECNGTYWHSELQGRGNNYHLTKTILCQEQGVSLLHIWEHDWSNKPEIIKSMIVHRLGKSGKIYARATTLEEISNAEANAFFEHNHLQGKIAGNSINIALLFNDEIVSVISLGKSRFNKRVEYELLRFANKNGTTVVGGASKLFTYFTLTYCPNSVISYADRMYASGELYRVLGFEFSHTSKPSYKYTKNFVDVYNRQKFQKHKLPNILEHFDVNLTEWENMKNNGFDKIWDCGNNVYMWRNR